LTLTLLPRFSNFFCDWKDRLHEFKLSKFAPESEIFNKCLSTVKSLQQPDDLNSKYDMINEINVKGAWKETQWGFADVWRVKGASQIAKTLYEIERRKSKEIDKAKEFIERACDGRLTPLDVTTFSDGYTAGATDVIGTIGVVDFHLSIGEEYGISPYDKEVLNRIRWLLDQQRPDGAWPVLSKSMWMQEKEKKESKILKSNICTEEKMNGNNLSYRNTVLMIQTLDSFLNKSLTKIKFS